MLGITNPCTLNLKRTGFADKDLPAEVADINSVLLDLLEYEDGVKHYGRKGSFIVVKAFCGVQKIHLMPIIS